MDLKKLPMNDEFRRCLKKLSKITKPEYEKRINEIENCHHLFLVIKKGNKKNTDTQIECVHCGLTNRFMKLEAFFKCYPLNDNFNQTSPETEMFLKLFNHLNQNYQLLNLISREAIPTNHPDLLYQLAITYKVNATKEEIFQIMNTLHHLETKQELLKLQTVEQAKSLMKRYELCK